MHMIDISSKGLQHLTFFGHLLKKKKNEHELNMHFFFKWQMSEIIVAGRNSFHMQGNEMASPYQRQIHTHPISHISPARSTSNHSEWKKEQEKDSFSFKPSLISTSVHLLTPLACHTSLSLTYRHGKPDCSNSYCVNDTWIAKKVKTATTSLILQLAIQLVIGFKVFSRAGTEWEFVHIFRAIWFALYEKHRRNCPVQS